MSLARSIGRPGGNLNNLAISHNNDAVAQSRGIDVVALARELDAIASTEAPELSAAIPGFAAALAWPDAEHTQLPC